MIAINNLVKRFGNLNALNGVSLNFSKGECIAILGPNGSGKTTLIKAILGMVVPDSGSVMINQVDIAHNWMYREKIGYMPQIGRYPENMTIANLINMMKDIRSVASSNFDEDLINSFFLNNLMHKKMRTLSGGTTQKVSACLAFLFSPDILILDEPTAGLDPLSAETLKKKIMKEKQRGKLIMITSHILSELDDLITEVAYMQDGNLLFHKKLPDLKSETGTQKLAKAITHIMSGK